MHLTLDYKDLRHLIGPIFPKTPLHLSIAYWLVFDRRPRMREPSKDTQRLWWRHNDDCDQWTATRTLEPYWISLSLTCYSMLGEGKREVIGHFSGGVTSYRGVLRRPRQWNLFHFTRRGWKFIQFRAEICFYCRTFGSPRVLVCRDIGVGEKGSFRLGDFYRWRWCIF